jgi:hypothetical protein
MEMEEFTPPDEGDMSDDIGDDATVLNQCPNDFEEDGSWQDGMGRGCSDDGIDAAWCRDNGHQEFEQANGNMKSANQACKVCCGVGGTDSEGTGGSDEDAEYQPDTEHDRKNGYTTYRNQCVAKCSAATMSTMSMGPCPSVIDARHSYCGGAGQAKSACDDKPDCKFTGGDSTGFGVCSFDVTKGRSAAQMKTTVFRGVAGSLTGGYSTGKDPVDFCKALPSGVCEPFRDAKGSQLCEAVITGTSCSRNEGDLEAYLDRQIASYPTPPPTPQPTDPYGEAHSVAARPINKFRHPAVRGDPTTMAYIRDQCTYPNQAECQAALFCNWGARRRSRRMGGVGMTCDAFTEAAMGCGSADLNECDLYHDASNNICECAGGNYKGNSTECAAPCSASSSTCQTEEQANQPECAGFLPAEDDSCAAADRAVCNVYKTSDNTICGCTSYQKVEGTAEDDTDKPCNVDCSATLDQCRPEGSLGDDMTPPGADEGEGNEGDEGGFEGSNDFGESVCRARELSTAESCARHLTPGTCVNDAACAFKPSHFVEPDQNEFRNLLAATLTLGANGVDGASLAEAPRLALLRDRCYSAVDAESCVSSGATCLWAKSSAGRCYFDPLSGVTGNGTSATTDKSDAPVHCSQHFQSRAVCAAAGCSYDDNDVGYECVTNPEVFAPPSPQEDAGEDATEEEEQNSNLDAFVENSCTGYSETEDGRCVSADQFSCESFVDSGNNICECPGGSVDSSNSCSAKCAAGSTKCNPAGGDFSLQDEEVGEFGPMGEADSSDNGQGYVNNDEYQVMKVDDQTGDCRDGDGKTAPHLKSDSVMSAADCAAKFGSSFSYIAFAANPDADDECRIYGMLQELNENPLDGFTAVDSDGNGEDPAATVDAASTIKCFEISGGDDDYYSDDNDQSGNDNLEGDNADTETKYHVGQTCQSLTESECGVDPRCVYYSAEIGMCQEPADSFEMRAKQRLRCRCLDHGGDPSDGDLYHLSKTSCESIGCDWHKGVEGGVCMPYLNVSAVHECSTCAGPLPDRSAPEITAKERRECEALYKLMEPATVPADGALEYDSSIDPFTACGRTQSASACNALQTLFHEKMCDWVEPPLPRKCIGMSEDKFNLEGDSLSAVPACAAVHSMPLAVDGEVSVELCSAAVNVEEKEAMDYYGGFENTAPTSEPTTGPGSCRIAEYKAVEPHCAVYNKCGAPGLSLVTCEATAGCRWLASERACAIDASPSMPCTSTSCCKEAHGDADACAAKTYVDGTPVCEFVERQTTGKCWHSYDESCDLSDYGSQLNDAFKDTLDMVKTTGGDTCVFPFSYDGEEYSTCITLTGRSDKVCATGVEDVDASNPATFGTCAGGWQAILDQPCSGPGMTPSLGLQEETCNAISGCTWFVEGGLKDACVAANPCDSMDEAACNADTRCMYKTFEPVELSSFYGADGTRTHCTAATEPVSKCVFDANYNNPITYPTMMPTAEPTANPAPPPPPPGAVPFGQESSFYGQTTDEPTFQPTAEPTDIPTNPAFKCGEQHTEAACALTSFGQCTWLGSSCVAYDQCATARAVVSEAACEAVAGCVWQSACTDCQNGRCARAVDVLNDKGSSECLPADYKAPTMEPTTAAPSVSPTVAPTKTPPGCCWRQSKVSHGGNTYCSDDTSVDACDEYKQFLFSGRCYPFSTEVGACAQVEFAPGRKCADAFAHRFGANNCLPPTKAPTTLPTAGPTPEPPRMLATNALVFTLATSANTLESDVEILSSSADLDHVKSNGAIVRNAVQVLNALDTDWGDVIPWSSRSANAVALADAGAVQYRADGVYIDFAAFGDADRCSLCGLSQRPYVSNIDGLISEMAGKDFPVALNYLKFGGTKKDVLKIVKMTVIRTDITTQPPPSFQPTPLPTFRPPPKPTPTPEPTPMPSPVPTNKPTRYPTWDPTAAPSGIPKVDTAKLKLAEERAALDAAMAAVLASIAAQEFAPDPTPFPTDFPTPEPEVAVTQELVTEEALSEEDEARVCANAVNAVGNAGALSEDELNCEVVAEVVTVTTLQVSLGLGVPQAAADKIDAILDAVPPSLETETEIQEWKNTARQAVADKLAEDYLELVGPAGGPEGRAYTIKSAVLEYSRRLRREDTGKTYKLNLVLEVVVDPKEKDKAADYAQVAQETFLTAVNNGQLEDLKITAIIKFEGLPDQHEVISYVEDEAEVEAKRAAAQAESDKKAAEAAEAEAALQAAKAKSDKAAAEAAEAEAALQAAKAKIDAAAKEAADAEAAHKAAVEEHGAESLAAKEKEQALADAEKARAAEALAAKEKEQALADAETARAAEAQAAKEKEQALADAEKAKTDAEEKLADAEEARAADALPLEATAGGTTVEKEKVLNTVKTSLTGDVTGDKAEALAAAAAKQAEDAKAGKGSELDAGISVEAEAGAVETAGVEEVKATESAKQEALSTKPSNETFAVCSYSWRQKLVSCEARKAVCQPIVDWIDKGKEKGENRAVDTNFNPAGLFSEQVIPGRPASANDCTDDCSKACNPTLAGGNKAEDYIKNVMETIAKEYALLSRQGELDVEYQSTFAKQVTDTFAALKDKGTALTPDEQADMQKLAVVQTQAQAIQTAKVRIDATAADIKALITGLPDTELTEATALERIIDAGFNDSAETEEVVAKVAAVTSDGALDQYEKQDLEAVLFMTETAADRDAMKTQIEQIEGEGALNICKPAEVATGVCQNSANIDAILADAFTAELDMKKAMLNEINIDDDTRALAAAAMQDGETAKATAEQSVRETVAELTRQTVDTLTTHCSIIAQAQGLEYPTTFTKQDCDDTPPPVVPTFRPTIAPTRLRDNNKIVVNAQKDDADTSTTSTDSGGSSTIIIIVVIVLVVFVAGAGGYIVIRKRNMDMKADNALSTYANPAYAPGMGAGLPGAGLPGTPAAGGGNLDVKSGGKLVRQESLC